MDKFDFSRFNRDFFKFPEKAFAQLFLAIDLGTISFVDFFNITRNKYSPDKIISSWLRTNIVSKSFILFLKDNFKAELLHQIKSTKVFQSSIHYSCIKECFFDDPDLLKQLDYWRNLWAALEDEIREARRTLAKYNFEDMLILCGLYYDKLRLIEGVHKNQDASLVEVVNLILDEKLRSTKSNGRKIKGTYSPEAFRARSLELLIRLGSEGDAEIEKLFLLFDRKADLQYLYDYYCYHDFRLGFFNAETGILKPGDESRYLKYMMVGQRYFIWQSYYHNLVFYEFDEINERIESSGMSWYNKRAHVSAWEHFHQFTEAGLPEEIDAGKSGKVDVLSCFMVINAIGSWSNIRWNHFIEENIFQEYSDNPYKLIWQILEYNLKEYDNDAMPVFFRNHKELMTTSEEIHHLKEGTAKKVYQLFTSNPEQGDSIDLSVKPFIKLGSNIYWIAGMMANKNYAVMLQNTLLAGDSSMDPDGPRNKQALQAEKLLAEWFEKNEFVCVPNFEYFPDEKNRAGKREIDLLAYKNGTLFVCQVKSTYHRATLKEVYHHFSDERTGIKKAIKQLERDVDYIQNNWELLRNTFNVDCTPIILQIVPIAVTTTLESGDGTFEVRGVKGYVVPLFELRVILTNSKMYLYNLSELALKNKFGDQVPLQYVRILSGIKDDPKMIEEITEIVLQYAVKEKPQFNLWLDGHKLCEPEDIILAIRNGSVWDMIRERKDMTMNVLMIGDYTINYFR